MGMYIQVREIKKMNLIEIIPSKLEVAPNALKMLDGVGEWMDGYPLDCYDY